MAEYLAPPTDDGYDPRQALHEVLSFAERFVVETPERGDFETWAGERALALIRRATADFLRGHPLWGGNPFETLHRAVELTPEFQLAGVGLTPPQLTLKLVAIEAGNRQAQERTRAGKRGIRIVYRLLKSLIASILANIPMLAALAAKPDGDRVTAVHGDMAAVEAVGGAPFDVVYVAWNSLFNLTSSAEQSRCLAGVAARLVANADELERLAAGKRDAPVLRGWRYEVFGKDAVDLIEGRLALALDGEHAKLLPVTPGA